MANPTTNYSFVLPTSSDLVTDLPADFDVALQGVDTRLKALQPGTTLGDLAYSSATANTNSRLGIGTNGQVLAVVAGEPAWATTADQTPLTTKGDLFTFSTVDARLPVGTNGQVLTADSSEATGLKFATPAGGGSMTLLTTTSMSGVSTVTVSSIDQTYNHLEIFVVTLAMTTNDKQLGVRFNGDTGLEYFLTFDTANTDTFASSNQIGAISSNTNGSNLFLEIPFYSKTTNAKYAIHNGLRTSTSGAGFRRLVGGQVLGYKGTAAITSITLFNATDGTTFASGSIEIYGVK